MKTNYEIRYAAHPEDAKHYDTARIRRDFLIEKVFSDNEVNIVYSMYDRMVVGGARPVGEVLKLEAIEPLKAPYFLTRREMGIFNVGGPGIVRAGDAVFELDYKEALYLGAGDREVTFESKDACLPAKFYFNSTTAHRNYPDKKITKADAIVAETGSLEGSNHRCINKMLVSQVLPTCQLQMGMTELKPGSVWNTMPAHVHSRRMARLLSPPMHKRGGFVYCMRQNSPFMRFAKDERRRGLFLSHFYGMICVGHTRAVCAL